MKPRGFLLICACVSACLAGCAPPAPKLYLLAPPAMAGMPGSSGAQAVAGPVLEVPRLHIPDYLDSRDIQMRDASSMLMVSRSGRWASRLSDQLTDTLVADLGKLHPDRMVTRSTIMGRSSRLLLDITTLELDRDGDAMMVADWSIAQENGSPLHDHERFAVQADARNEASNGTSDARVITLLRELIRQLAARIQLPVVASPS